MPIHRLNERPTRHAVLGDITCDSDGKVDQFIDRRDVKRTLPLHTFDGSPYYLGVFLVGAYQEILGDLHNLLGDTHAVHVSLDANDAVVLDAVIKGDTVREVLDYVEFDTRGADGQAAVGRRDRRPRRAGSTSKNPAGCSGSTKTASTDTPTSKIDRTAEIGDLPGSIFRASSRERATIEGISRKETQQNNARQIAEDELG